MKLKDTQGISVAAEPGFSRRGFLSRIPLLGVIACGPGFRKREDSPERSGPEPPRNIRLLDSHITFVGELSGSSQREIPPGFIHSHFPPLPPIIRSATEESFPWEKETVVGAGHLGAINEGVYTDGKRILQIVASTPGTPDTGSGSPLYKNWYRISTDGGKTYSKFRLLVVEGHTTDHPMPGVALGRNGYTTPFTSPILKSAGGEILVPVNLHPWDKQHQRIYNPADAFLFGDSGVLIGKWNREANDLIWSFGNWLRIDHNRSTRGLFEPSLAELDGGERYVMVARGSNYRRTELPSFAWVSFSTDRCRTWSVPEPFRYSDGTPFYVPASCSTLYRSAQSRNLYWIGNLTHINPKGNHPRNPLVIGQVSENPFGLIKNTVLEIDRWHPGSEGPLAQLSNFKVLTHEKKDEIVITLTRRIENQSAEAPSWYHLALT